MVRKKIIIFKNNLRLSLSDRKIKNSNMNQNRNLVECLLICTLHNYQASMANVVMVTSMKGKLLGQWFPNSAACLIGAAEEESRGDGMIER